MKLLQIKKAEEDVPQFLFQEKLSSEEIVKMLAKGGGKEAEEDSAQFLFAYNVALSADPTIYEKMKNSTEVSPTDVVNAQVKATEFLDTTTVIPPDNILPAKVEPDASTKLENATVLNAKDVDYLLAMCHRQNQSNLLSFEQNQSFLL
jgi:hypothetical protein